jgi:hypothetical protein
MTTRTPVANPGSELRRTPAWRGRAVLGAICVLVGTAALAGLIYIGNGRTEGAERALISLGLAGSVLVSAIAQTLVVVGLWLLWSAARGRRR